jgi:hypothetical protein
MVRSFSVVTGDYKCIAAWRETTSEEAAWVLCNVGGTVYAVMVADNGPYTRVHLPKDPNALGEIVFGVPKRRNDSSFTLQLHLTCL